MSEEEVTITIVIGNTDNKLTQQEWCRFVDNMMMLIGGLRTQVYFFGAPPTYAKWQNAAWVIGVSPDTAEVLKEGVKTIRKQFRQQSVAWLQTEYAFV